MPLLEAPCIFFNCSSRKIVFFQNNHTACGFNHPIYEKTTTNHRHLECENFFSAVSRSGGEMNYLTETIMDILGDAVAAVGTDAAGDLLSDTTSILPNLTSLSWIESLLRLLAVTTFTYLTTDWPKP
ncbi:hypothetical protein EVAR_63135_1 [Eumeta japonica]|uniref:Uncharacterized protein n=1 Tax=Eumeta variegata TaxID=151549 RepID=A0A4C2A5K3_EUMVA|nr:hypothetical protein EVAR_63135_1 [Eumeta japonica]